MPLRALLLLGILAPLLAQDTVEVLLARQRPENHVSREWWTGPSQVLVETERPDEILRGLPRAMGKMRFSRVVLGDGADSVFAVVIDRLAADRARITID